MELHSSEVHLSEEAPEDSAIDSKDRPEIPDPEGGALKAIRTSLRNSQQRLPLLEGMSQGLETRFLEIGTTLERLVAKSEELLSCSEAMRAAHRGGEVRRDLLTHVVELLEGPLRLIASWEHRFRDSILALQSSDREIENLFQSRDNIRRALSPLALVQKIFGIETVLLPSEVRESFATLSSELRRLHDELFETFAVRLRNLAESRETIRDGATLLRNIVEEHQNAIGAGRIKAERTLATIHAELDHHQSHHDGLAEIGRHISNCVGRTVMGVQAQDIISQRLGHVVAAIRKLSDGFEEAAATRDPVSIGKTALYVGRVAQLQSRQLDGIRRDALQAGQTLRRETRAILNHTARLRSSKSSESGSSGSNHESQLDDLEGILTEMRDRLGGTESRMRTLCERIAPLGRRTSDLTSIMRELSEKIWLIGLNAQVKSSRVAQNGVLRALSTETRSLASQTREVSTQVGVAVDDLNGNLVKAVTQLNDIRDLACAQRNTLDSGGNEYHKRVAELSLEAGKHASRMEDLGAEVRILAERIEAAARLEEVVVPVVSEWSSLLHTLEGTAQDLAELNKVEDLADDELDQLKSHYTMAAEIETHEAAMGSLPEGASRASNAPLRQKSDGDVELWDSETLGTYPSIPSPRHTPPPLETTTSPPSAGNTTPGTAEAPLGANVELF